MTGWILQAIETEAEARVLDHVHEIATITVEADHRTGQLRLYIKISDDEEAPSLCFDGAALIASIEAGLADTAQRVKDPNYCSDPETHVATEKARLVASIRRLADKVEALPCP